MDRRRADRSRRAPARQRPARRPRASSPRAGRIVARGLSPWVRNGFVRAFAAYRRVRAVAGMHDGRVAESQQHVPDGSHERGVVAAGQIGAPDRTVQTACRPRTGGCPPRRARPPAGTRRRDCGRACGGRAPRRRRTPAASAVCEVEVRRRGLLQLVAEGEPLLHGGVVQEHVVAMDADAGAGRALRPPDAAHVIHVRMRQQDEADERRRASMTRSRSSTSSPGSMRIASRLSSHATTKPFL